MNLAIIIVVILIINYIFKTGSAIYAYFNYDTDKIQEAVGDLKKNMLPNLNRNTYLKSAFTFGIMLAGCVYLLMFLTN